MDSNKSHFSGQEMCFNWVDVTQQFCYATDGKCFRSLSNEFKLNLIINQLK